MCIETENTKKGLFMEHVLGFGLFVFAGHKTFSKIYMFPVLTALSWTGEVKKVKWKMGFERPVGERRKEYSRRRKDQEQSHRVCSGNT